MWSTQLHRTGIRAHRFRQLRPTWRWSSETSVRLHRTCVRPRRFTISFYAVERASNSTDADKTERRLREGEEWREWFNGRFYYFGINGGYELYRNIAISHWLEKDEWRRTVTNDNQSLVAVTDVMSVHGWVVNGHYKAIGRNFVCISIIFLFVFLSEFRLNIYNLSV